LDLGLLLALSTNDFSAMTKTFFADTAPLMSPRTAKYVEAMIREGDNFDYNKWLQKVRGEEAQAKQALATSVSGELVSSQIGSRLGSANNWAAQPSASAPLMIKTVPVPRATSRSTHKLRDNTPKARLRQRLEKIRDAWDDFQASRARDAVYGYLEAVFAIVEHYKVRRRAKKLLRHAFEYADQPLDKSADPFTAVIRCTCDDEIDSKTISQWARALRYAAHCKAPRTRLKKFMKEAGGVNACATRYAKLKRRRNRQN
jgi:hypothetical protein